MLTFICAFIGVVGVLLIMLPTEFILTFDGQTGRWLYEHSKNKDDGVRKARKFYRVLGAFCLVISILFLLSMK